MNELTIFNKSENLTYNSINLESIEEKKKLLNAINDPDKQLTDCANIVLNIKDVYVEPIERISEDGVVDISYRVILIDTKGTSYVTMSKCVFNSLSKIIMLMGEPTWEDGLQLVLKQKTRKNKDGTPVIINTLSLA